MLGVLHLTHKDSLSPNQIHSESSKFVQIHSFQPKFTQSHPDPPNLNQICSDSHRFLQSHTDLLSFMQLHSDSLRFIKFHSVSFRFTQTLIFNQILLNGRPPLNQLRRPREQARESLPIRQGGEERHRDLVVRPGMRERVARICAVQPAGARSAAADEVRGEGRRARCHRSGRRVERSGAQ